MACVTASCSVTIPLGHLQVKQDLADGHATYLFRCPAELPGQDKAGPRQRGLDQFFQRVLGGADAADIVDALNQKAGQASRQF